MKKWSIPKLLSLGFDNVFASTIDEIKNKGTKEYTKQSNNNVLNNKARIDKHSSVNSLGTS